MIVTGTTNRQNVDVTVITTETGMTVNISPAKRRFDYGSAWFGFWMAVFVISVIAQLAK